MNEAISQFQLVRPSPETDWRSIVLFGKNTASYKFALARALLDFARKDQAEVNLEDLAVPYANSLCEHMKTSPRQTTNRTARFLEVCKRFNERLATESDLVDAALDTGFRYVLDAFPLVNSQAVRTPFYVKDFSVRNGKRLILTDDMMRIGQGGAHAELLAEIEARWALVETAWQLNIPASVLRVTYEEDTGNFIVKEDASLRRKAIAKARYALNGYQKGKSFYCFDDISMESGHPKLGEVEHFFPRKLQKYLPEEHINIDGVWNLVVACQDCNRGISSKSDRVPDLHFLDRLFRRNEYLISSDHPLKETLIAQTGKTTLARKTFLQNMYSFAMNHLNPRAIWNVTPVGKEVF